MRIDLIALASAPEPVEHSGRTHAVRPLSVAGWQFLQDWETDRIPDDEKLGRLLTVASKHIDLPADELADWTVPELQALLMHCGGLLAQVKAALVAEDAAGNAAGRPASRTTGARSKRTKR